MLANLSLPHLRSWLCAYMSAQSTLYSASAPTADMSSIQVAGLRSFLGGCTAGTEDVKYSISCAELDPSTPWKMVRPPRFSSSSSSKA